MVIFLSSIRQENGIFVFVDYNGLKHLLFNAMDFSLNHSNIRFFNIEEDGKETLSMLKDTALSLRSISDGSVISMVRNIVFLSVLDELIQKPHNYNFLQIGDVSSFTEQLANILKKFNVKNHLYCITENLPSKNILNVSFLTAKLENVILPYSKFSAVFIDDAYINNFSTIPTDLIMSLKNCGNLFFITNSDLLPKSLLDDSKVFVLHKDLSLVSLSVTEKLKHSLYLQTSYGKLEQQKRKIINIVDELSKNINELKNYQSVNSDEFLDQMISSVYQCELMINKIYIELKSSYIKTYFNELKEILIDYRLNKNESLKENYYERIKQHYQIARNELTTYDDFIFSKEAI